MPGRCLLTQVLRRLQRREPTAVVLEAALALVQDRCWAPQPLPDMPRWRRPTALASTPPAANVTRHRAPAPRAGPTAWCRRAASKSMAVPVRRGLVWAQTNKPGSLAMAARMGSADTVAARPRTEHPSGSGRVPFSQHRGRAACRPGRGRERRAQGIGSSSTSGPPMCRLSCRRPVASRMHRPSCRTGGVPRMRHLRRLRATVPRMRHPWHQRAREHPTCRLGCTRAMPGHTCRPWHRSSKVGLPNAGVPRTIGQA
mmetsp:Transcript_55115/g.152743  ORF Transcript_55115/g.152743 Transcript_55115/m.152743 type:complete len:256 (-) Transcript_55115:479-1246(-)